MQRYNLDDFYSTIGVRTSCMMPSCHGIMPKPLVGNLFLGLFAGLFLALVPCLYLAIFRARRKHARTVGQLELYMVLLHSIYLRNLGEREDQKDDNQHHLHSDSLSFLGHRGQ